MNVLVLDIGGSHVKMLATGQSEPVRFESGKHLTPDEMMTRVRKLTADWKYDVVTLGYPGPVGPHGPTAEAGNLGGGWVGYDFQRAFGRPVRVVNDAAMRRGGNDDAFAGGFRLWEELVEPHDQPISEVWRVAH